MTAILDTGPLVALAAPQHPKHERAAAMMRRVLRNELGTPLTSDLVLMEGLTLIEARWHDIRVAQAFASIFHGARDRFSAPVRVRHAGPDLIERAVELHLRYYDQRLSTVDCLLVAMAEDTGGVVVTFDGRFDGLVPIVKP